MSRRSRVLTALAVVAALVVATTAFLLHRDREQEWRHGGDDVDVSAQVRAVAPAQLAGTLEEIGERPEPGIQQAAQMAVVRVTWEGTSEEDGSYAFLLLDDRVSPADPLHGDGATGPGGGGRGPHWSGAYQALSEHYPWLARTADQHTDQGWTNDTDAFGFDAADDGEAVLTYYFGRDAIPTSHPERDLALAVAYVRDGQVRWAKQVPMEPLA